MSRVEGNWWRSKGFGIAPVRKTAVNGGIMLYRCWGGRSEEWGSGYFSLEKPDSVSDAELRFNIADWGNEIHFISTFKLKEGFVYWLGPVAHGPRDLSRTGTQAFIEPPLQIKLELIISEVLKHDVFVAGRSGNA
jgi:hypothetical protein